MEGLHACAAAAAPDWQSLYSFVNCTTGAIANYLDIEADFVSECSNSEVNASAAMGCAMVYGDRDLLRSIDYAVSVGVQDTPVILIDSKSVDPEGDLLAAICDAWTEKGGAAPVGCGR